MNCPRCEIALESVNVGPGAHLCRQCEGVWIHKDTLSQLVRVPREELLRSPLSATLEPDHPDIPLGSRIQCPVCRGEMLRYNYCADSGVTADRCPEHGMWLDDGELELIIEYLQGIDFEDVT